jgi:hypothetical protein
LNPTEVGSGLVEDGVEVEVDEEAEGLEVKMVACFAK